MHPPEAHFDTGGNATIQLRAAPDAAPRFLACRRTISHGIPSNVYEGRQ